MKKKLFAKAFILLVSTSFSVCANPCDTFNQLEREINNHKEIRYKANSNVVKNDMDRNIRHLANQAIPNLEECAKAFAQDDTRSKLHTWYQLGILHNDAGNLDVSNEYFQKCFFHQQAAVIFFGKKNMRQLSQAWLDKGGEGYDPRYHVADKELLGAAGYDQLATNNQPSSVVDENGYIYSTEMTLQMPAINQQMQQGQTIAPSKARGSQATQGSRSAKTRANSNSPSSVVSSGRIIHTSPPSQERNAPKRTQYKRIDKQVAQRSAAADIPNKQRKYRKVNTAFSSTQKSYKSAKTFALFNPFSKKKRQNTQVPNQQQQSYKVAKTFSYKSTDFNVSNKETKTVVQKNQLAPNNTSAQHVVTIHYNKPQATNGTNNSYSYSSKEAKRAKDRERRYRIARVLQK